MENNHRAVQSLLLEHVFSSSDVERKTQKLQSLLAELTSAKRKLDRAWELTAMVEAALGNAAPVAFLERVITDLYDERATQMNHVERLRVQVRHVERWLRDYESVRSGAWADSR